MTQDDEARLETEIATALDRARVEDWKMLWEAVDLLEKETTFATWTKSDIVGTRTVDGEGRPVQQMPYPVYSQPVELVRERLANLGLSVAFDWMNWDGITRYRLNPAALDSAPVSDAVRLLTAIARAERFGDGNIEGALMSGLMQAALARLRGWYNENHAAS